MTTNTSLRWKPFRLWSKLRIFWNGIRVAALNDRNVATQIVLSLIVLMFTFWQRQWFDFALIAVVTGYLVVVEMINTAIEAICDYMQPDYDPSIGAIKDIGAAASGIAILIWLVAMLYELGRIWPAIQG